MSQDALLLCVHIFLSVSLSLSISLCLFIHLSLILSLSHWWFILIFFPSCGIWDPIHIHCSTLIPSSGWAPAGRMGNSRLRCRLSPPLSLLLAMRWCHGFYLLQGYPLIFSPYYTLPISPPSTLLYPHPTLVPPHLRFFLVSKGAWGIWGCLDVV